MPQLLHWMTRIVGAVLVLSLALFAIQNVESTSVTFIAWTFRSPLFVVIILSFAVGFIVGWLYRPFRQRGPAESGQD